MLTPEEIACLSAIVPPPVGTVSVGDKWILLADWTALNGFTPGEWPPQPDPECPAWQGAMWNWLGNVTGGCSNGLWWAESGDCYAEAEDKEEVLCRLVLAVAGRLT